jgi:hypothetical protein
MINEFQVSGFKFQVLNPDHFYSNIVGGARKGKDSIN